MQLRAGRRAGVVGARSRLARRRIPTITGAIFEFGFSDAILQMWAAFLDELAHGRARDAASRSTALPPRKRPSTHRLFTAALAVAAGRDHGHDRVTAAVVQRELRSVPPARIRPRWHSRGLPRRRDRDARTWRAAPTRSCCRRTPRRSPRSSRGVTSAASPIVPRGGGTGFAGGAVPLDGGVVLVARAADARRSFDPLLWRIEVEAGVRTAERARASPARAVSSSRPIPGAAEQSQIGGNVATNAGGPHAFKYGVTGAWVTGLEAVCRPASSFRSAARSARTSPATT